MFEVLERTSLTVEAGSRVLVSPGQALAAGRRLRAAADGGGDMAAVDGGARRFDFSPATFRAMVSRLTADELKRAATEAGLTPDAAATKAELAAAVLKRVAPDAV